jgi:hypothetical protein
MNEQKSNLDHVHCRHRKKKEYEGNEIENNVIFLSLGRKRKPAKQTNLIKMHYTSNPKLHVASFRIFSQSNKIAGSFHFIFKMIRIKTGMKL